MAVILEVRSSPSPAQNIRAEAGGNVRVGRTNPSDVTFLQDSQMSSVHFGLAHDGENCWISDLNSRNGTRVNGELIKKAILREGDLIVAGQTTFAVKIEQNLSVDSLGSGEQTPASGPPQGQSLQMLRTQFQPLYAVLDAARDPQVLDLLRGSQEEFQSLYEGRQGEELADFAPYVVRVPSQSPLLEALVRKGWGKSWGVYLTCDQPLKELRRHFRHFLIVKLPDGREAYFRYYDPRVLRGFLPTCTADQANEFFGPVKCFMVEDEVPQSVLQFTNQGRGAVIKVLSLSSGGDPNPLALSNPPPHIGQSSGQR
jgi:hypothetical protein